jgi:hypothetical protein
MQKLRTFLAAAAVALSLCLPASASQIGQAVAGKISVSMYQHWLDDVLLTHNGMNKGINGAEHDPCRDNIAATFESFGLTVELFPFTYQNVTYYNVIATKTGTQFPDSQYVLGAHYDTVNNPGADDDASGVAVLLEIARVMQQFETAHTIKFCAFDREEQGKIGSTAYVAAHNTDDIKAMVQIDMIAHDVGLNRENMYGNAAALPLKQALAAAAGLYGNGINFADAGNATFSDHAPFAAAGYQAIAFVEHNFQQFGCYHQPCDSVDTPNYIHYSFAANLARAVAGYIADHAQASRVGDIAPAGGDGFVGPADLGQLLSQWGQCPKLPAVCPADLTDDNIVGPADLAQLLAHWG